MIKNIYLIIFIFLRIIMDNMELQRKTEKIEIRVTPEEKEQLRMNAVKVGLSMSSYYRFMLKQILEQEEKLI